MVSPTTPSWKQKRSLTPVARASLRRRRLWSTCALLAAALLTMLTIYRMSAHRSQETWILYVGNMASENQFALPPVRFVQQCWQKLNSVETSLIHVDKYEGDFAENLSPSGIKRWITRMRRNDALIVWINGIGIVRAGRPVVVGNRYRLPEDPSAEQALKQDGLLEISDVLQSMDAWPGPKLLILDWGQEVFDPRIGCLGNNFLDRLQNTVKTFSGQRSSSPIWLMVSHLPRQISLVDVADEQSIFNRAVLEAFSNQRLVPEGIDEQFTAGPVERAPFLTLDSVVEYVHRRVRSDSQNFQTPWLLKTGEGIVTLNDETWSGADEVRLMALDAKTGMPLGVSAPQPTSEPADKSAAQDTPAAAPRFAEELNKLWQTIDALRHPDPKLDGWSEAALAPLAYKHISSKALALDLRAFAGFQSLSDISALLADLAKHQRVVQPEVLSPLEAAVNPAERDAYLDSVQTLRDQRQVACLRYDTLNLIDNLRKLRGSTISVDELQNLATSLSSEDASAVRTLQYAIPMALDSLIDHLQKAETNRGEASAFTELMLQSSILSASQRAALRSTQQRLSLRDVANRAWPARPLETPRVEAIEQTQLLPSGGGRNVGATIVRLAGSPAAELKISDIMVADGRDILFSQDTASLWRDLEQGLEFPIFPPRPEAPSQWLVNWRSTSSDPLNFDDPLRLDGSLSLAIELTRTGRRQIPLPKITLVPHHLRIGINRQVYGVDEAVEIDPSWFAADAKPGISFDVLPGDDPESWSTASLTVTAQGSVGQLPSGLVFELPVNEPIELLVTEKSRRDGQLSSRSSKLPSEFTLLPFVGRETKYQFALRNADFRAHAVELNLYALAWNEGDPDAVFGQVGVGSADISGRIPDLTWRGELAAQTSELAVFSKPVVAPAPENAQEKPDSSEPATAPPPTSLNVAGGCLLQLIVDGNLSKRYMLNVKPKNVVEYLEAESQIDENGKLSISVQWLDRNQDGWADLAPDGLTKEQPLTVHWDPLPWRGTQDINITNGQISMLDDKVVQQTITAEDLRQDQAEQEVWLDVDGAPRVLIFRHYRNRFTKVSLPEVDGRYRYFWRRIALIDPQQGGLAYVPFTPPRNDPAEKDTRALSRGQPAVYPDLKGVIDVQLAIDLPQPNERCSLLLGPDHVLVSSPDRIIRAELTCVDDCVALRWTESDLHVPLDFSKFELSSDQQFPLSISSSFQAGFSELPSIVADCEPPRLTQVSLSREQVTAGSQELLELGIKASDSSGIIVATVSAKKQGAPAALVLSGPIQLQSNVLASIKLDVGKLEPGDYEILVSLEDLFHHSLPTPRQLPKPLRIVKPLEAASADAAQLKGDLRVQAKLPTGRALRNAAEFKIEPAASQQTPSGRDQIVYNQLKSGSYTVSAVYSEASDKYEGKITVELKSKDDFAKLWFVELVKAERSQ